MNYDSDTNDYTFLQKYGSLQRIPIKYVCKSELKQINKLVLLDRNTSLLYFCIHVKASTEYVFKLSLTFLYKRNKDFLYPLGK